MSLPSKKVTCGSLFSGIGGFCFGFERAGFETLWANDNDQKVSMTYKKNFESVEFLEQDIAKLETSKLRPVDVIHAGFPCQSFSSAGNRLGFDDPRGMLFEQMMDKLNALSSKPKVLVFENSSFLPFGDSGNWFNRISSRIRRSGYWFSDANALRLCPSINFGYPQRRERLFMVATNRDYFDHNPFTEVPAPEKRISLLEQIKQEPVHDEFYYLADDNRYAKWLSEEGRAMTDGQLIQLRQHIVRLKPKDECPTLTANMGSGGHNVPFLKEKGRLRKLTERECLNLQGFPQEFVWPNISSGSKYQQIGNAVSPTVSFWLAKKIKSFLKGNF